MWFFSILSEKYEIVLFSRKGPQFGVGPSKESLSKMEIYVFWVKEALQYDVQDRQIEIS